MCDVTNKRTDLLFTVTFEYGIPHNVQFVFSSLSIKKRFTIYILYSYSLIVFIEMFMLYFSIVFNLIFLN